MRFHQKQAQVQNTPDYLFSEQPQLFFKPEQKICPLDGKRLQVLKTQKRTIKTTGVGTVQAHHTILYCKRHAEIGPFRSNELDELAAANSTVAYAVIVEIGKLRFLQKRQIKEIQSILLEHHLKAIGKLLFDKENDILRKALSKAGISGKLKEIRRKLNKTFDTLSIDEIEIPTLRFGTAPQQPGHTREASELLAYYLVLWILDHAAEGNGYGFPFDQRYLYFYQRLEAAHTLIEQVKSYYPALSENDRIVWESFGTA